MENCSLQWELVKMKLREYTIKYSKQKAKQERNVEDELNKQYNSLYEEVHDSNNVNEQLEADFEQVKIELERINAKRTEGTRIRSRVQLIEEDEKNTKYFLNAEKRNYKMKHITKLKDQNGLDVTNATEILNLQQQFYEKLYSGNTRNDSFDKMFTQDLPKISLKSFQDLENPFTDKELSAAVKSLKGGKAPGTDGFTANFYKFFWIDIKDLVSASLKYAFENNLLSEEQRRAILRLIPKHDKDLVSLKNWRPISLLNTDYKILAQTLAIRLQKILPEIISKNQNGYLEGRFIGINIRTIIDAN
jgi:hypothetical protein